MRISELTDRDFEKERDETIRQFLEAVFLMFQNRRAKRTARNRQNNSRRSSRS